MRYSEMAKIRRSKGISQEEVATSLGLSRNQFSQKEKGDIRFWVDEVTRLERFYHVPLDDLITAIEQDQEIRRKQRAVKESLRKGEN